MASSASRKAETLAARSPMGTLRHAFCASRAAVMAASMAASDMMGRRTRSRPPGGGRAGGAGPGGAPAPPLVRLARCRDGGIDGSLGHDGTADELTPVDRGNADDIGIGHDF